MGLFFRETQLQSQGCGDSISARPRRSPSSCEEQQSDLNGLLPEGHLYCRDAAESITLLIPNNSVRSAGYTISHMRKLRIREVESFS